MRIGLSYHGGDEDYDAYVVALKRRAGVLGLSIETLWLAGAHVTTQLQMATRVDAIVLTGGADVEPHRYGFEDANGVCSTDRRRDEIEWDILERTREQAPPMLAICRGAQILNVFHGGSLLPDLGERNALHRRIGQERREHAVDIAPGTLLHCIAGCAAGTVNSSHHQAVDRLADGFCAGAYSEDGVVEAFEATDPTGQPFMLAVQWHPEAMQPGLPLADRVLDAFLRSQH